MKVAIVCGSPSSEFLAPFNDPEWAIWVLGNRLHHYQGRRVNCVFEIHNNLSEHPASYAIWLANQGIPLVVSEEFPVSAPHIAPFDYEASGRLYGSLYLTSSPAYMISHALLIDGITDIAIYGVDLSIDDHEYYWQRPCVEAWIGFAKGRGVNVHIPEVSHVGKCPYVEGRDWNGVRNEYGKGGVFAQAEFINMADSHTQKMEIIDQQISQLVADKHTHNGARQAYERLAKVARATEARMDIKSLSDTTIIK